MTSSHYALLLHAKNQKRSGGHRCPVCNFRFSYETLLQLHIEGCFERNKTVLCNGCGKDVPEKVADIHIPMCLERLVSHSAVEPTTPPQKVRWAKDIPISEVHVNGLGGNPLAVSAKKRQEMYKMMDRAKEEGRQGAEEEWRSFLEKSVNGDLDVKDEEVLLKLVQHRSLLEMAQTNPNHAQTIISENFEKDAETIDSAYSQAKQHWYEGVAEEKRQKAADPATEPKTS